MRICTFTITFFMLLQNSISFAYTYSTQDIFLITKIEIIDNDQKIDILEKMNKNILTNNLTSLTMPGGAKLTLANNGYDGKSLKFSSTILINNTVKVATIESNGETCIAIIVTPNIETKKRTIGLSDIIDINITNFIPDNIFVGSTGVIDYTLIQTTPIQNESENDDFQIFLSRIESGNANIVSTVDWKIAQISNYPFVIGEGSKTLRFFAKGILVIGSTASGVIAGASFGSAVPAVGTIVGGILGGSSACLTSVGGAILMNTKDDDSGESLKAPTAYVPTSRRSTYIDVNVEIDTRTTIPIPENTEKVDYQSHINLNIAPQINDINLQ
ncbi:MAG: hypothetical protein M0P70_07860 [Desulfobulbaceae bacterium]|nr:hypothetical protein [Desulfobulbaceae bacterium]